MNGYLGEWRFFQLWLIFGVQERQGGEVRKMANRKVYDKKYQIVKKTKENMQNLGTFKKEFEPTIRRYADVRIQYDSLNRSIAKSLKNSEDIPPSYFKSIDNLQKQLLVLEDTLGLTPKGLKTLQRHGLETKKVSMLEKALSGGI